MFRDVPEYSMFLILFLFKFPFEEIWVRTPDFLTRLPNGFHIHGQYGNVQVL